MVVLAVSPADAISVTSHPLLPPRFQEPCSLPISMIQNTAISTITGGVLNLGTAPATGKFIGAGSVSTPR
jgi:hypothetical protein